MLDQNLQAAERLLEWWPDAKLFPAQYKDGQHIGLVKWGEESSGDIDQIREWANKFGDRAYLCLNLRKSGLICLDVDNKNGKAGSNSLFDLCWENEELPSTMSASTPSGGDHYIFNAGALKGKYRCNTNGGLGVGLDIPVMVPVPGTAVVGKGDYKIVAEQRPNMIPGWLSDKVKAFGTKKDRAERQDNNVEPDQPANVAAATAYLMQDAPPLIEGTRDTTTYKVACKVRDHGISQEMCEQLMLTIYLPRQTARGDWEGDDVVAKVDSAYLRAEGDFGNATAEGMGFTPVSGLPTPDKTAFWDKLLGATVDLSQADLKNIPPRDWLIYGRFLCGNVTETISPGGVGKSTLSMLEGLAVNLNMGHKLIGRKTTKQHAGVWVYNLEDPQDELDRRCAAMLQHYKIKQKDVEDFYLTSGLTLGLTIIEEEKGALKINRKALDACKQFITERCIRLWIIDPLVKVHRVNENDNGAMDALMTELSKIATRTGCAIHIVHHTRKKGKDGGNGDAETGRGASSVSSAVRVAHTVNGMSEKEAAMFGLGENNQYKWFLRIDDAKSNFTPPADDALWYKRVSVKLDNGDPVGVLELADLQKQIESISINKQVMDAVVDMAPEGMYPLNKMAEMLDLTGEFFKEDGTPMAVSGLRAAIERVFGATVESRGKTISIGRGLRTRHSFSKRCVLWLDTEYSDTLKEKNAVDNGCANGVSNG